MLEYGVVRERSISADLVQERICGVAADASRGSAGGVCLAPRQEGLLLVVKRRREPVLRCGPFQSGGSGDFSEAVRKCFGVELYAGLAAQTQAVNSTPHRAHLSCARHAIFIVVCTWLNIIDVFC